MKLGFLGAVATFEKSQEVYKSGGILKIVNSDPGLSGSVYAVYITLKSSSGKETVYRIEIQLKRKEQKD